MNEEISEKNKTAKLQNLPEGWKWVRLGEVIGENNKSHLKVEDVDNDGNYPFFTSGGNILKHSSALIDGENLFLSTGGSFYVYYYKGKASYSTDTYSIRSKIETKLLYYILCRKINYITFRFFIGSGLEHLQKDDFKSSFFFIFPESLPEQQKIAEILETVDNAIEKTDQIIEKYKRIKQGLMQELLTKGIDEKGKIRTEKTHHFKASPIGRIPEEWEVKRLGEVGVITMGLSPKSFMINNEQRGLPFLQGNAEFSSRYPQPISWIEQPIKVAPTNSILISVRAPVGALNLSDREYCIGRGLASIKPDKDYLIIYFLWYVLHLHKDNLIKLGQGSTFEAIGSKELYIFLLPLPPLPEQQRIAEILSQIDEVIEKETQYRDKLKRLKAGLMQDLLTGKVRVNKLIKQGA